MLITSYGDCLELFIDDLVNKYQIKTIQDDLRFADIQTVTRNVGQHEKANATYAKWRRSKIMKLEELRESKNLTVFQKLQRAQEKKSNTVFDRLKRMEKS